MDIVDKITGVIFGLFGSIIASLGVSLAASVLTDDPWAILFAGLIVGVTSSFANAFGPLISSTHVAHDKNYSKQDIEQALGSSLLTLILVCLPLTPYILVKDLALARMISVMTGLALLFILGVQHAQLKHYSPLLYGFMMVLIGVACAFASVWAAQLFM